MTKLCQRLAASEVLQTFILWIILLTALSMGLEAIPVYEEQFADGFEFFFYFTQTVFALEITIRLLAFGPNYRRFFDEFWNTFDFVIVVVSFLPGPGALAPIARLVRVLRVLRVISVSDRLRRFLDRMGETLDELCCTLIITFVLGYIFVVAGNFLFFEIDAANWGTLGRSALSVFYLLLLQNVPAFVEAGNAASRWNILYYLCFYFTFFSLIINVIAAISAEHRRSHFEGDRND